MAVVGFNFNKMSAERKKPTRGRLTINNTVTIIDVEETKLPVETKGKSVKLSFAFSTKYEPDAGIIELTGEVIYLDNDERVNDVLKQWKAKKTLPDSVTEEILNSVLAKCHIEAIILSRDINLPAPVALPKVGIAAPVEAK